MLTAKEDLERRRPVWAALSELFLDTELTHHDLRYIAEKLVESRYSDGELTQILFGEVFPVCIWNLRSVAGEWADIDADWLEKRILRNAKMFWKRWRWTQPNRWMIRDDWQWVMTFLHEQTRDVSL